MQNEKAVPCKKQKSCKQKAVLSQISAAFSLTPMEWPWHYLHGLQAEFDLSKLKFTEDFYDPDMNPNAPERKEDWKVYFNGSLWGHHGRERAQMEREHPLSLDFTPSLIVNGAKLRTACSALRFAAADHADWRVGFRETPWEEGTFGLI